MLAQAGFNLPVAELTELELAYIGGLLRLDIRYDEAARMQAMDQLKNRRRASPDRKG